jgi:hypothetical protein
MDDEAATTQCHGENSQNLIKVIFATCFTTKLFLTSKNTLKVRLHYGDYHSKLARCKEHKNIFLFFETC